MVKNLNDKKILDAANKILLNYKLCDHCFGRIFSKIDKISMEYHNIDEDNNHVSLARFLQKKGFDVKIKKDSKKQGMIYARNTRLNL